MPGKPKGLPKTGGRQAGTPNKTTNEMKELARSYCTDALKTLHTIMNSTESPQAARVAAANSLLDRGFGKPAQQTIVTGDDENGPVRHVFVWEE